MPIANKDQLFQLIKSLSKAEKRNFKLYVGRLDSNKNPLFLQLFDALDKLTEPDNSTLIKKMKNVDSSSLTNLKRHLYSQILTSLRLIHSKKDPSIQIRENIDLIDFKILKLLNDRMEQALMAKKFKSQIEDREREKDVLDRIRKD